MSLRIALALCIFCGKHGGIDQVTRFQKVYQGHHPEMFECFEMKVETEGKIFLIF